MINTSHVQKPAVRLHFPYSSTHHRPSLLRLIPLNPLLLLLFLPAASTAPFLLPPIQPADVGLYLLARTGASPAYASRVAYGRVAAALVTGTRVPGQRPLVLSAPAAASTAAAGGGGGKLGAEAPGVGAR